LNAVDEQVTRLMNLCVLSAALFGQRLNTL